MCLLLDSEKRARRQGYHRQPPLNFSCFRFSFVRYSSGGVGLVRYRTAVVLSAVLVAATAGMFGLPAVVWAIFLPSLKLGLSNPIPGYERILLDLAIFCSSLKWMLALLALPVVVVLFTVAEFTSQTRVGK